MRRSRNCLTGLAALGSLAAATTARAQVTDSATAAPDSIVGLVINSSGAPVADAFMVLTRAPDAETSTTSTDAAGRFIFRSPGGTGEYGLMVTAVGYRPYRQRLLFIAGRPFAITRVVLDSLVSTLDEVRIVAERVPPERQSVLIPPTGAMAGLADGSAAALSPLLSSVLDLARTSLAGTQSADGWSVAGLSGRESQTQLNGMLFRGAELPTSLPKSVRLAASTWDITNAGFSGGLIAIDIPLAGEFGRVNMLSSGGWQSGGTSLPGRSGSFPPQFALDLGGAARNAAGTSGVTFGLRLAAQGMHAATLNSAGDDMLTSLGANPDGAHTASQWMNTHFPEPQASAFSPNAALSLSSVARIDPKIQNRLSNSFMLATNLNITPRSLWDPLTLYSRESSQRNADAVLQWNREDSRGQRSRWESTVSLTLSRNESVPLVENGTRLRVNTISSASENQYGTAIELGGAPPESGDRVVAEGQLIRDAFAGKGESHRTRLLVASRIDALRSNRPAMSGMMSFNSVDALSLFQPEYLQTVQLPDDITASAVRVSAGAGDEWRVAPSVRLQYGLRTDVSHLAGGNSNTLPLRWSWSPRIGMSWQVRPKTTGEGYSTSQLFSRQLVPAGLLRMGVGVFHRDLEPDDVVRFGSAGNIISRSCVGAAPLTPSWAGILPEALDAACAASGNSILRESQQIIDRSYRPPSSIRATGSYLSSIGRMDVEVGGLLNLASGHSRQVDPSVTGAPLSLLSGEGGRGFFAPDSAIVLSTGLVRRDLVAAGSAQQWRTLSDLGSRTMQFTTQLSPRWWADGSQVVRVGYTFTKTQLRASGWESDAFGDPNAIHTSPGRMPLHQFQAELGKELRYVNVTLWLRTSSGSRFSPLVAGDVNGDGIASNDRAWLPARQEQNPELWSQINELYSTASSSTRHCLDELRSLPGRAAVCTTPWSFLTAMAVTTEMRYLGLADEGSIRLYIENAGALAQSLFGIPESRGWGATSSVNPWLLRPVQFDADRRAFSYAVNPAFNKRPLGAGGGGGYRISLAVEMPLSAPIQQQQVKRWLAVRGVGKRLPADTLAVRFARNVPPLYETIVLVQEDLLLSAEQRDLISARRSTFETSVDEVWMNLGRYLSALPASFSVEDAAAKVEAAADEVWEMNRLEAHALRDQLTPIQQLLLPADVRSLMAAENRLKRRIIYY